MEKKLYDEMVHNVQDLRKSMDLASKNVFVFGHCNASLELIDLLDSLGIQTQAILDNSENKKGISYKGVTVIYPDEILSIAGEERARDSIVLIVSRFYASMVRQLKELGYRGSVRKVIDYNSYAEYSLAEDTIARMWDRKQHGKEMLDALSDKYNGYYKVFCPFNALGDIYFMCSYWKSYAAKHSISEVVFCVTGKVLADVIHMFEDYSVEIFGQKELDAMIQAVIYENRQDCFIAHQDRPYVVSLQKALYIKKIPLEQIYCCGVYGLPADTKPAIPRDDLPVYDGISDIPEGKSVIFSPYAKSVVAISDSLWKKAVDYYSGCGYKCFTNVVGDEKPLEGTEGISPTIAQMRSVVERAGVFIGIRSGMCDILREAKAKKIALYPDYNYSDTRWKAIEMYHIDKFDYNLLATEDIEWEKL
jgi:hypothetical protein